MLEDWLSSLGCPYCHRPLALVGKDPRPLHCGHCDRGFGLAGRIPVLLRREDVAPLARFSRHYRTARLTEGWQPLAAKEARALPYARPAGYPSLYWPVRRQSFCALMGLLAREGPSPAAGPVADLGAGNGWLSYRLAQAGHRALAVEASRDADFGLGAAEAHYGSQARFLAVQGHLEHPPLPSSGVGLVLFNASLHYARDLEGTLVRASQTLRPDGRLIVLDSPIARQSRPGSGRGDRHLGRRELHQALVRAGLRPRWIEVRRGPAWWRRQLKVWLKGGRRFSFPLIVAGRA